jgi:hypothetical protein
MSRFLFHLLIFFLALGIGLMFGLFTFDQNRDSASPTLREPRQPSKHYDFFADAPTPERNVSPAVPPIRPERKPLTCTNKNILPVWKYLAKDERIYETEFDNENTDCTQIVEVHYVDLNKDRQAEILVRGKTTRLCGGVGNCAFWIFQKTRHGYRELLAATDYVDRSEIGEQLLNTRTKGYSDLLLKGHFTAAETGFYFYKFDGSRYRQAKCRYEVHEYDSNNNLRWKFITCEQFSKRVDDQIANLR